ncbi:MAG: peptidyl-prolyl cis-trans isomerase [Myxococcota bacterium]|nr:peptidyl-prolyl cis-trans isomerase [Myxococcota bacterium]
MRTPRVVVALALLGLVACTEKQKDGLGPDVVASVNGEPVSRAEFEGELARSVEGGEKSVEQLEPLKRATLESMVERVLLLQTAKQLAVAATDAEVDREVLRVSSDYPAAAFDAELAKRQLTMAEFKQKEAARLTVEKLFKEHVYPRVALTEEEIRHYYEEHSDEFNEPEQVRAAQIVVKGLDEARRIQQQLRSGKRFADLARRYSLSADAKVGGDLGFFARGVMPPKFDEVAFKLATNQISDVVETEYGFHLFRILEKRPAKKRELVDVRREVEAKLLEEKRVLAQESFLKALREKAQIVVNEQALLAVTVKGGPAAESKE